MLDASIWGLGEGRGEGIGGGAGQEQLGLSFLGVCVSFLVELFH